MEEISGRAVAAVELFDLEGTVRLGQRTCGEAALKLFESVASMPIPGTVQFFYPFSHYRVK